jgi:hypothetical protein
MRILMMKLVDYGGEDGSGTDHTPNRKKVISFILLKGIVRYLQIVTEKTA